MDSLEATGCLESSRSDMDVSENLWGIKFFSWTEVQTVWPGQDFQVIQSSLVQAKNSDCLDYLQH
jgi:hypothetical protein